MSRRRYITTDTAVDKRLNKIARDSDFVALFYLMMIPHVGDDCRITGDPEELLGIVFPLRRDKEPEDVADALNALHAQRLLKWNRYHCQVMLPPSAFYRYQAYVHKDRRASQEEYDCFGEDCDGASGNGAVPRSTAPTGDDNAGLAHIGANQRTLAQNDASVSVSVSPSVSSSVSVPVSVNAPDGAAGTATTRVARLLHVLDDPPPDMREIVGCLIRDKYAEFEVELALKHLEKKHHEALNQGGTRLLKLLKSVIEEDIRQPARASPEGSRMSSAEVRRAKRLATLKERTQGHDT